MFWPTVARRRRLESDLDEQSFCSRPFEGANFAKEDQSGDRGYSKEYDRGHGLGLGLGAVISQFIEETSGKSIT